MLFCDTLPYMNCISKAVAQLLLAPNKMVQTAQ